MLYIVLKLDFKNEKKNSFWSRFRNKFGTTERDKLLRIILFVIFYLLNLYTRYYVICNSWKFVANYVTILSQRGYTIKTFEDMFEEREKPCIVVPVQVVRVRFIAAGSRKNKLIN